LQWRGDSDPQTGRQEDLALLYTSRAAEDVKAVLQKYGITYVVVGPRERELYPGVTVPEMPELFEPVPGFEQAEVAIYQVRPGILSEVTRE
jgi:uncharacterized membrane protein